MAGEGAHARPVPSRPPAAAASAEDGDKEATLTKKGYANSWDFRSHNILPLTLTPTLKPHFNP